MIILITFLEMLLSLEIFEKHQKVQFDSLAFTGKKSKKFETFLADLRLEKVVVFFWLEKNLGAYPGVRNSCPPVIVAPPADFT